MRVKFYPSRNYLYLQRVVRDTTLSQEFPLTHTTNDAMQLQESFALPPDLLLTSILSSSSKIVFMAFASIQQQTIYEQLQVWLTLKKKHRALFHVCVAVDSLLRVFPDFFWRFSFFNNEIVNFHNLNHNPVLTLQKCKDLHCCNFYLASILPSHLYLL